MLELRGIDVNYGRVQALKSVSLSVPRGSIFAVLGANGAGKSTLLRAVLGLKAGRGVVCLEGRDITRIATYQRVRCVIDLFNE
jgi:ABC-type branched-subunit amino acid transport system ATPase component